jgi:predicted kinase
VEKGEKMKVELNNYDHVKGFNVSVIDTIELEGVFHVVYFHTNGKYAEEMTVFARPITMFYGNTETGEKRFTYKEDVFYEESHIDNLKGFPIKQTENGMWYKISADGKLVLHTDLTKRVIHCMIGLPRNGKSTYVSRVFAGLPVLSADSIRECISIDGDKNYFKEEKRVWDILHTSLESMMKTGVNEIVIDNTSLNPKGRKQYVDLAKQYNYHIEFTMIETDNALVLERCKETNFPTVVIDRMSKTINLDDLELIYEDTYINESRTKVKKHKQKGE